MNKFEYGHIPTSTTSRFMSRLLRNEEKYEIGMELEAVMGKPWQIKEYSNVETGNEFWGEPMIQQDREDIYTYTYGGVNWGIKYHFKGRRHNTKGVVVKGRRYGTNISNDRLYYILVNAFNGGCDFVATYLEQVSPYTIGGEITNLIDPVIAEVEAVRITRAGTRDRRAKIIRDLERGVGDWQTLSSEVESRLKDDFVACMKSGQVPTYHVNAPSTQDRKQSVYGMSFSEFVASGQFVESIQFSLNMRLL